MGSGGRKTDGGQAGTERRHSTASSGTATAGESYKRLGEAAISGHKRRVSGKPRRSDGWWVVSRRGEGRVVRGVQRQDEKVTG